MKILITGASGFVGSHTVEALHGNSGIQLRLACRDKTKLSTSIQAEICPGNITDNTYLDSILKEVDVLVNAFAWTSVWGHAKQSRRYMLEPTLNLYQKAIAHGVKRIVNISSTAVAAPDTSSDPMSRGIPRNRWPHLNNVIAIEDFLRERANDKLNIMNLRVGLFTGKRYALGMLPVLLPRLKTHLVPWIAGGKTTLGIIDGRDIGQAVALAAKTELSGWQSFNVIGPERPTVREVIQFIHEEFNYPRPHFSVPFYLAYPFGSLMELIDPIVPWEPLVTRSIVHLLEETSVDNQRAETLLHYQPHYHWKEAVRNQIEEMRVRQHTAMPLANAIR